MGFETRVFLVLQFFTIPTYSCESVLLQTFVWSPFMLYLQLPTFIRFLGSDVEALFDILLWAVVSRIFFLSSQPLTQKECQGSITTQRAQSKKRSTCQ